MCSEFLAQKYELLQRTNELTELPFVIDLGLAAIAIVIVAALAVVAVEGY